MRDGENLYVQIHRKMANFSSRKKFCRNDRRQESVAREEFRVFLSLRTDRETAIVTVDDSNDLQIPQPVRFDVRSQMNDT